MVPRKRWMGLDIFNKKTKKKKEKRKKKKTRQSKVLEMSSDVSSLSLQHTLQIIFPAVHLYSKDPYHVPASQPNHDKLRPLPLWPDVNMEPAPTFFSKIIVL